MVNKKQTGIIGIIFCMITGFTGCHNQTTIKDLDENMLDLRIYQENLGDMIKEGRLKDAEWLLQGADSLLQVISNTFTKHRKLEKPFSYFYNTKLKKPLKGIQEAINNNDTGMAIRQYRILVNRCNSCHEDHDVDKEVHF
jgi:hypothetical protein